MEEPLQIVSVINQYFSQHETQIESSFKGKNALVTAGPTVEVIDPVRFVSNRSSGKMGFAIATALQKRGANVTLVSGPTRLDDPKGVNVIRVESAKEMFEETLQYYDTQDIVIKAAA
ncbi:phosphopantothenoylcysteine decarboxylase, partial [Campylobacter jejuni]